MFQVLVVDDEPSAVEYICNMIRLKCPGLNVAGTAGDGREGLVQYRLLKPDLVISDVKMPVMDGLEMVKSIKEQNRDAQIMLVSGYQEFEYVKAALKYGVSDYVLKPMTPASFIASVTPIMEVLNKRVYEQRTRLVRAMVIGEQIPEHEVRQYFPEDEYYLSVIRENGLPRRFSSAYEIELISEIEHTIFVYGRDEREALYICPALAVSDTEFLKMMETEAGRKESGSNFVTAAIMPRAVRIPDLSQAVLNLYKGLNSRLSVGVSQIFFVPDNQKEQTLSKRLYGTEAMKNLERQLEKKEYAVLLEQLWKFIKNAGETGYPQLQLERFIRQLAVKIQQYLNYTSDVFEDEMMLEDAFYYAGSPEELFESVKSILSRYWKEDKEAVKLDSPQFLDTIKNYIDRHLSEDMAVSTVCREFGLSQSYLNMIFRKHGMQSFNTYLRTVRIERAKSIMERNPQMFIKDVALMSGYKDQFYFSRIFRAMTGSSPTEYLERISL